MTKHLADYRREYGTRVLSLDSALACPLEQFHLWFEEIAQTDNFDPTAMLLATVDSKGHPDSRVVLLKGFYEEAFVFYTNYQSKKAQDIEHHPFVALNFFWPTLARQVRVRGAIEKLPSDVSDAYFASRPKLSQLSAHASSQSQAIASRQKLEEKMNKLVAATGDEPVLRPKHWGGYHVKPTEIEFWQGRDNRLHDRLRYQFENNSWEISRLEP